MRKEDTDILLDLSEVSWRSAGIAASLAKIKQYANRVDSGIQKIESLANSLKTEKDESERNKIHTDVLVADANVLLALRKIEMYSSLLTASGVFGLEKTLTKRLKTKRRR